MSAEGTDIRDKIIVAFDVSNKGDFQTLLRELSGAATYIKIGMECFYSLGPESLADAKQAGMKVFLDLKLHDIPNTVYKSVYSLCRLGADMINVHALGGHDMMSAASEAVARAAKDFELASRPKLIAVTHLTSLDQVNLENELGIQKNLKDSVLSLSEIAQRAGLDGVVSSALEAGAIKKERGSEFLTVTPGIRMSDGQAHDQKRVMTPAKAVAAGSDFLVMGRSITQASDPRKTYEQALKDIT